MTQAYPLQWPLGKPRTKSPQKSRFGSHSTFSVDSTRNKLMHELRLLGAKNVVISTNIELRKDGAPYSGRRAPDDPGVAVYFTLKDQARCFACDKWEKIEENIAAIMHTIAALRGIERWGGGDMVEQAFSGFAALPAPKPKRPWYEVLGVKQDYSGTSVRTAYRMLAYKHHPDTGDNNRVAWDEIQQAYEDFKAARGE